MSLSDTYLGRPFVTYFGTRHFRSDAAVLLLLVAAFVLVWPVGDYAIMDDWIYVKSLEHLHFDGDLRILEYNPMSLIGHLFVGVLFTKAFGFSFTVTKCTVVFMQAVYSLTLLRICRTLCVPLTLGLTAVAALLLNPLHFVHAFMFMTDVPSLAWQLPAPEMAIARVASWVRSGGHDIPSDVVIRRYHAGLQNFFQLYCPVVDTWPLFDSSA